MKPTHVELELELHQTKAELSQTRELLKRAVEESYKLVDEVPMLKEKISKNSKTVPSLLPLIKKGILILINLRRNERKEKATLAIPSLQKELTAISSAYKKIALTVARLPYI